MIFPLLTNLSPRRITSLLFDKLASASAWLFVGTVVGGSLSYVFQVLMGRMLSPKEYGLFSSMLALYVVLGTPLATLMMLISRRVSGYVAQQDSDSLTHFFYSMNVCSAFIGVLGIGLYLFFLPKIQFYLKAPSIEPVYLLGLLLFVTTFPSINNAFIQGLQKFKWYSALSALSVLIKTVISALLIWLGFGVAGAIGGIILSYILIWLISCFVLFSTLAEGRFKTSQKTHLSLKSDWPVIISNSAFTAMTQLDVVLVNYYFPAHEAGLYASASVLGKAVMYLPGGIVLALFPMVAANHARNESSSKLLFQAVGLTVLLCGAAAIFYFLFGKLIINVLYGDSYNGAGDLLQYFGIAIFPMALVMVAEHFLIAKGRVMFAWLFLGITPIQLLAISQWHDQLWMIIANMGVSGSILALIGYGFMWRDYRSGNKSVSANSNNSNIARTK